ncbi:MAG: two-component system sensor histidine kinase NtrB [Brevefilum sp.]
MTDYFADLNLTPAEKAQSNLTLFNLISDPAIIYHHGEDSILAANNALFLLTNLGENDFIHQSIKSLLPDITDTDPISGHDKKAFLRHKKQALIPVTVRIFALSQSDEYLVIVMKPQEGRLMAKSVVAEHSTTVEGLIKLIQTSSDQQTDLVLGQILEKASAILGTSVASLYKATGSFPPMTQHTSDESNSTADLPPYLTEEDLLHHQQAAIWTPDLPAVSSLHRSALEAGLKYMVSVPLEIETTKFGLFVAGSHLPATSPHTLPLAKLISVYTAGLMENRNQLQNLRNLNNKIRQVVKIQNEIITNLEEGVIILAPDLTVAEINPAAETILGYANVEALRQPVDTILIGSESLGSALRSAQQGIPTLTGGNLTIHHRSGRSFPAQILMSPVMSNGQLFSIIMLIRDISQQEQSQAANKQLEQRAILGEVTAIFAHEVRNPINAIMLALQVIEDDLPESDPNHKWIDNIRDECNKLMYLMESVLSFAKPLEYKMAGVDLDFLLSRILERWHPRLMRLNISPYYESEIDNPIIEGDLRALEQVFTNLISNSVNAMTEKGGALGIKITETDNEEDRQFVQINITDTGTGIPDEIKAHMFKPFVTGSKQGTGLGLSITQHIINAHKGKIEVDSYPGGTIFKIFLLKKKGLNSL